MVTYSSKTIARVECSWQQPPHYQVILIQKTRAKCFRATESGPKIQFEQSEVASIFCSGLEMVVLLLNIDNKLYTLFEIL